MRLLKHWKASQEFALIQGKYDDLTRHSIARVNIFWRCFCFTCPLLLSAQSDEKKNPPPPSKKSLSAATKALGTQQAPETRAGRRAVPSRRRRRCPQGGYKPGQQGGGKPPLPLELLRTVANRVSALLRVAISLGNRAAENRPLPTALLKMAANPAALLRVAISLGSKAAASRLLPTAPLRMAADLVTHLKADISPVNKAARPRLVETRHSKWRRPGSQGGGKTYSSGQVNRPDGGKTVRTQNGNTLQYNKTGKLDSVVTNRGTVARYNPQGGVRTIQTTSGTTVFRGPGGQRKSLRYIAAPTARSMAASPRGRIAGTPSGPIKQVAQPICAALTSTAATPPSLSTVAILTAATRIIATFRLTTIVRPFTDGATVLGDRRSYTQDGAGIFVVSIYGYYFAQYPFIPRQHFANGLLIAQNFQAAYAAQAQAAANANAAAANANAAAANANAAAAQAEYQAGAPQQQQTADAQVTLTPEVKELISQKCSVSSPLSKPCGTDVGVRCASRPIRSRLRRALTTYPQLSTPTFAFSSLLRPLM